MLKQNFDRLNFNFSTNPVEHDSELMTQIRSAANALTIATTSRPDRVEANALRCLLQNVLFEQATQIFGLTQTKDHGPKERPLTPRWNLKAAMFFAVAARLADDADETFYLRSRANDAEIAFRQTYPIESKIPDPKAVADLMAFRINHYGVDRHGIPIALRVPMVGNIDQHGESVRRVGAVVAALRTHDWSIIRKDPVPPSVPSDPRLSLRRAYGGSWRGCSTYDVLHRGGVEGDIDLMWGRVKGRPRLIVRTVKSGTGLFIDAASMSVTAAVAYDRNTDKHPWLSPGSHFELMRVPPLQKDFASEIERAAAVGHELEMGAFKEGLNGFGPS